MKRPKRFHLFVILILVAAAGAAACWFYLRPRPLDGFAQGNGRIEATEVDIATKFQGRIAEISVDEGDMVDRGQTVARMDTASLEAQLKQAEANVLQARSELSNDKFVVAQRKSEYDLAEKNLARAEFLVNKGALSAEEYDIRFAAKQTAKDAIAAAEAQVAVAEARIEAALAETVRIKSDIDDSILKSPIRGRVEFRIAEPGEVLSAGGKVLTLMELSDVYMTIFLPETQAGKVALGAEGRIILDNRPTKYNDIP